MEKIGAVILGIFCVVGVLIPVGIAVCVLMILTNGSMFVLVVGAGLGVSFACYCGYRAALAALGNSPSEGTSRRRLPPVGLDPTEQDHRKASPTDNEEQSP
jgi:hypothetical protein